MARPKATNHSDANKENSTNASNRAMHCNWTDIDDSLMVELLINEKDGGNQSGAGWKKQVWIAVQELLAKKGSTKGGEKTALKCSDHWANVSALHCLAI
jgi:hypothetical protein